MHGDLETLYDAHAHRLYAHCWSLLGDHGAAEALGDSLTEAVRYPPRGELVLWLHHLTRTVCAERGAFSRHGRPVFAQAATDPLLNAAGNLPGAHREALLLSAGEWLDVRDIAAVLRVTPGTVRELLHEARTALERAVLDALIRGTADPARHMEVIAAFEKGRLPHLLARRAPGWAPAGLRDRLVSADQERDETAAAPAVPATQTGQLVVIGSDTEIADSRRERARHRKAVVKSAGGVAVVAASVAAGLMMTWPSAGEGTVNALGPSDGNTRTGPAAAGNITDDPVTPENPGGNEKTTAPAPEPTTQQRDPVVEEPADSGGGGGTTSQPKPPESDTPSTPSSPPSDSRQNTPAPPPESSEPDPDDGSSQDGPLDPITDIVGGITSPIVGGLTGR